MKTKYRLSRILSILLVCAVLAGQPVCANAKYKDILLGDADQDGAFTSADARIALRFAVSLDIPTAVELSVCDIDGNGAVDSGDARIILRVAVGLEDLGGRIGARKLEGEPDPTTVPPETTTQPPATEPVQPSYPGFIDAEAKVSNWFLSEEDMQVNAKLVARFLMSRGWTLNAVCGALGNMEKESTINPGIPEIGGTLPYCGFGLVQWTPGIWYLNWATLNGYEQDSLEGQLVYMDWTMQPSCPGEAKIWYGTPPLKSSDAAYGMSYSEFIHSYASPAHLAMVFMCCYERPGVRKETQRMACAEKWFEYLTREGF